MSLHSEGFLKIRQISRLYFNKGKRLSEIYFLCTLHLLPICSFRQNDHFFFYPHPQQFGLLHLQSGETVH